MPIILKSGLIKTLVVLAISVFIISATSVSFAQTQIKGPAGTSYIVNPDGSIQIDDGDIVHNSETIKSAAVNDINTILKNYKTFILFVNGIGLLYMIKIFIINFVKLGASGENPQERKKAITALVLPGLAITMLGAIFTFMGFALNFLK